MHPVVPPPNPHLHSADGWTIPPLDGSLSVPELYDFHLEHNSNHPVFVHASAEVGLKYLRYSDVVPAAHRAGWLLTELSNFDHSSPLAGRPIIAILAASDTITYFTTCVGMLRAGIPFLPISPRNSPAAIAHLVQSTHPTHFFVSVDVSMRSLAEESLALMEASSRPPIVRMPSYEDLYTSTEDQDFRRLPPRPRDPNMAATNIIVHSSGSTSFPKPIRWTDRTCIQASMAPFQGEQNYTGKVFGTHCLAMFHAIGLNFLNWMSTTGLVLAVFPPASPAIIPSFDAVWDGIVATKAAFGFGPPIFLETWAKDPAKVKYLKESGTDLIFGGGPLAKATGDMLASEGINLFSLFGITEANVLCKHLPKTTGMDWEYLPMNPALEIVFGPQEDGTYELIVISKPHTEILVVNTQWQGQDAYGTNDLFIPHPTLPNRWKLVGRKDDQLVLSTGEKTNPTPLEQILSHDPHVSASVMFGSNRFQNGLLVELKPPYRFDPTSDMDGIIKYRSLLWPSVEKMNAFAPSHSRLFKEMIIFTHPSKPFTFTTKGAPQRKIILSAYQSEIEALYAEIENTNTVHPESWTPEASLTFVRNIVNANLAHPAKDEEDIFERGCDSLQAAWIRNNIVHALRDAQPAKARSISTNFVYDYPRISSLAAFICESADGKKTKNPIKIMQTTLAQLTSSFPSHRSEPLISFATVTNIFNEYRDRDRGDVVLLTGTTGALGAALLATLISDPSVRKVYAFNRPSVSMVHSERQKLALETAGYDPSIANSPKVVLVEADMREDGLGVGPSLEREIRNAVTHIIHNAWRVDFNLSLASYESILKGMRTLIDLALTSPHRTKPRVIFTSSVAVLSNVPATPPVAETALDDPSVAVGQGYGESKWVGEQMLYIAAREAGLRVVIARIGQIAGGPNGAWRTSDWVPAIIKSSIALGCLPEFKGTCTWIPLDVVAGSVADLRHAEEPVLTAHIVHPEPQPSREIFQIIAEYFDLPLVPYSSWLQKLEGEMASSENMAAIPAIKLLDFFKSGVRSEEGGYEALAIPAMECEEAKRASLRLRRAKRVEKREVISWLESWVRCGFLEMPQKA